MHLVIGARKAARHLRTSTMRRSRNLSLPICFALLISGTNIAGAGAPESKIDGRLLLQKSCSRCHSIDATGGSPLAKAPPFREIYLRYPIEQLEYGFAEGMGSRHPGMPQIQFSDEQAAAIISYLGRITGVDPSTRPRAPASSETPP
jgi:mono/diheme cytochrome c family protein